MCRPTIPQLFRRAAADVPVRGEHSDEPCLQSPTRPFPAIRATACRFERANSPRHAGGRASGNLRFQPALERSATLVIVMGKVDTCNASVQVITQERHEPRPIPDKRAAFARDAEKPCTSLPLPPLWGRRQRRGLPVDLCTGPSIELPHTQGVTLFVKLLNMCYRFVDISHA